jgi:hypothetical protein
MDHMMLVLVLVGLSQKLELVESKVGHYRLYQRRASPVNFNVVLHPLLRPAICAEARPCLNIPAPTSGFNWVKVSQESNANLRQYLQSVDSLTARS